MAQFIGRLFPLPSGIEGTAHTPVTFWSRIQLLLSVLRPTWPAAFLSLAVAFLLQIQQTREVFYGFVDETAGQWFPREHFWGLLALLGFSLTTWYFSRVALYVRYWFTSAGTEQSHERWRQYFPRALGALPLLSAAAVYVRQEMIPWTLKIQTVGFYLSATVALVLFFVYRRHLWRSSDSHRRHSFIRLDSKLNPTTIWLVIGIELVCILLNVLFIMSKVYLPQWFGPLAIVFYAMTAWTAFGSLVVGLAYYKRWPPPLPLIILYAAFIGLWSDNHAIDRSLHNPPKARPDIGSHLRAWIDYRAPIWKASSSGKYPVFIVTAEGGGIRAAYWTASVLDQLQTRYPAFACHLLALSGVSGGSLGSATFVAELSDQLPNAAAGSSFVPCQTADAFLPNPHAFTPFHHDILNRDFLGPVFAGALFPDVVQRVLFPTWGVLALPDRAQFLEAAWEEAWPGGAAAGRFAQDFLSLWQTMNPSSPAKPMLIPSLFLNATWVETGGRAVISNLALSSPHFSGADDLLAGIRHSLKLSTAVHASARFSYISPAGTVEWFPLPNSSAASGKSLTRRLVDGGYFENSGAVTGEEILHLFGEICTQVPGCDEKVVPVVLILSNDYNNPNRNWKADSPDLPESLPESDALLTGLTSPITALFNTRSARGYYAEDHLREQAGRTHTLRLQLPKKETPRPPLGWLLSDKTRGLMDCWIERDSTLELIGQLLGSSHRSHQTDRAWCKPKSPQT